MNLLAQLSIPSLPPRQAANCCRKGSGSSMCTGRKNSPRKIYFMANKPCDKGVQSPEPCTPPDRLGSSGLLLSDGCGPRQGWLTTYQVCSGCSTTPRYRGRWWGEGVGGLFSFSSLEFHPLVQTTPSPQRVQGEPQRLQRNPQIVDGQVSSWALLAMLRRKAPSGDLV